MAVTATLVSSWMFLIIWGNFLSGRRGALREFANLIGYYGKASTLLTRARCLDCGVERQHVGLIGDVIDDADDAADLVGPLAQLFHLLRGCSDRLRDATHLGQSFFHDA